MLALAVLSIRCIVRMLVFTRRFRLNIFSNIPSHFKVDALRTYQHLLGSTNFLINTPPAVNHRVQ